MPGDERVNFDPKCLAPREYIIYPEEISGNPVEKVFLGTDRFFDETQVKIQLFQ